MRGAPAPPALSIVRRGSRPPTRPRRRLDITKDAGERRGRYSMITSSFHMMRGATHASYTGRRRSLLYNATLCRAGRARPMPRQHADFGLRPAHFRLHHRRQRASPSYRQVLCAPQPVTLALREEARAPRMPSRQRERPTPQASQQSPTEPTGISRAMEA